MFVHIYLWTLSSPLQIHYRKVVNSMAEKLMNQMILEQHKYLQVYEAR